MKIGKPKFSKDVITEIGLKKKAYKLKRCLLKTHKYDKVIVFPNLNPNLPACIEVYIATKTTVYHFTIDNKKLNILFPYNVLPSIIDCVNILEIK